MHPVVKYCIFIIITKLTGVVTYPQCYNWCAPTSGYAVCCDYYYQGGQFQLPLYCPLMNCSVPLTTLLTTCSDDNDCLRKEKCCANPCDEGKKSCFIGAHQREPWNGCPRVNNCKDWTEKYQNSTICNTHNDCRRSELCCSSPCINVKKCQKITSYNTGHIIPNNCPIGATCY